MSSRREFTVPVKRAIRARSGGVCEVDLMPPAIRHFFPKECPNEPSEVDHIYPDVLEDDAAKKEPLKAEDGAHLCWPCHHLIKCREDAASKKKRNAHKVRDDRPQKPKTVKRPIRSPGFQTNRDGAFKAKIGGGVERRS